MSKSIIESTIDCYFALEGRYVDYKEAHYRAVERKLRLNDPKSIQYRNDAPSTVKNVSQSEKTLIYEATLEMELLRLKKFIEAYKKYFQLDRIFANLTDDENILLELKHGRKMSQKEIGKFLGIKQQTVNGRLERVYKKIERMEDER